MEKTVKTEFFLNERKREFEKIEVINIRCPFCLSNETSVLDSRATSDSDSIRRRRECPNCQRRFTTYERIELSEIFVVKKDGRREPFSREKLLRGIVRACEKRPVKREKIEQVVDQIQSTIISLDKQEISSKDIGQLVMNQLKDLDDVAYVRFASVYKRFRDASQFMSTISMLKKMRGGNYGIKTRRARIQRL